jgi:hypothetical protein
MELTGNTQKIIAIMRVLIWIVFIGLCIKTGALLFSFFVSQHINAVDVKDLYLGLNLSRLKAYNPEYYSFMVALIVSASALKAYMFYLAIKMFSEINFAQPFSDYMASLITDISYVALAIGVFTLVAGEFNKWLTINGVTLNTLSAYLTGGAEFLFLAGVVFMISIVFKRGIEIQAENDLTI